MQTEHPQGKILLVDDSPVNLGVLFEYLNNLGFSVFIAQSGEMAFKFLETERPDIILLDVKMPGIDGFAVCRQLKSRDDTKDIPVIFMTALSETTDKVTGFEVGGVDYITKPFQQEEVLARIKTHLTIHKLQQELEQKNALLQELNTNKDTFFSIIAHDLRSPFTGLLGISQIILEGIDDFSKDEIKSSVAKLHESAEGVFKLLENLLSWSRLQRGTMTLQPQPIHLNDVVDHTIHLFTATAQRKAIELRNTLEDMPLVYADLPMLNTIMRNLVANSIKFTYRGGHVTLSAKVELTASATPHPPEVAVTVADTGIGIPEEKLSALFRIDQKYQRKGTQGETGTGLGLLLCKELVEANGGRIWVESQERQGTTFGFSLPVFSSDNNG
jgi:two-component system, sensor histidine kinase and response regulator